MLRKGLSLLLCMALCLTLIPAVFGAEAVFEQPEPIRTDGKLALVTLRQLFPKELTVHVGGETKTVACEWECVENYDDDLREFHFTPVLQDAKFDAELPVLTVVIEGERETPPNGLIEDGTFLRDLEPYDPPRKRGETLPSYYNAYELGLLPAVRDQGRFGLCWAFSVLGCMEADLIHDGAADTGIDLSELHLGYCAYHDYYDEKGCGAGDGVTADEDLYLIKGGSEWVAYRTLANMTGCATEKDVPYEWGAKYRPGPYAARAYEAPQLAGAYELPVKGESGRDSVKDAILNHGAVYSGIYMKESAYYSATYNSYCAPETDANHSVMLVGWDDDFPKENFAPYQPETDGAWLARNSWGGNDLPGAEYPDYGAGGYFWLAYGNGVFNDRILVAFDVQPRQYDHCYSYAATPLPYDTLKGLPNPTVLSQTFRVDGGERIDAVGFETADSGQTLSVSLTCGDETVTAERRAEFGGYHLIPLDEPLTVAETSDVTMRVTVTADGEKPVRIPYQPPGTTDYLATFRGACGGGLVVNGENIGADGYLKLFTTDTETVPPAADEIRIDAENFPNAVFRTCVSVNFDLDRNGYLSEREREAVTVIDLTSTPADAPAGEEEETEILGSGIGRGAKSVPPSLTLKGVELFPSLTALECGCCGLSELDVSQNPLLTYLGCSNNELTRLDLSGVPLLRRLDCFDNPLTELDLSGVPLLTHLDCFGTALTELDLSGVGALEFLDCTGCVFSELDVSPCGALKKLYCCDVPLTALDLTHNPLLEKLDCSGASLTELDLSQNPLLAVFVCSGNQLTALDLTQNPLLETLMCDNNRLTELNVSRCGALQGLNCAYNALGAADVTHCPELVDLICDNNQLTELDITACPLLVQLSADDNLLTELDVTQCPDLTILYFGGNQLTELDVTQNPYLLLIAANGNRLTELDLSGNPGLLALHCANNGLKALDLSFTSELNTLEAQGNDFTQLDLCACWKLYLLYSGCEPTHPDGDETVVAYLDGKNVEGVANEPCALVLDSGVELLAETVRIVTPLQPQTVWTGETATFSVVAEGDDPHYLWYILPVDADDWLVLQLDEPELSFPAEAYMDGWAFSCTVYNDLMADYSEGVILTVLVHKGDTNADGAIDMRDLLTLRQAMSGGYGVTVGDSADLNRDGEINMKDLLLLRRHLAGGYGVVLE